MSDSTENEETADMLEAYKVLEQFVATDIYVPATSLSGLIQWFIGHANAANITENVVTALFEELFPIGAITPDSTGYQFSKERLATSRFATMVAEENRQHISALTWVKEVLEKDRE